MSDDADTPWSYGVSVEVRGSARKLFLEGNRLFRVPLFARAAEQYTAALSQWKHPAFYFNLALAQINLGKEIEARESLEHALAHGQDPLGKEQFKEAQKQLEEVNRQLGRIHVICHTPGAEVTLDGVTLFIGPGNYEGWVKAKTHEITAKKTGYLSEARRVTVSSGQFQDIELKLLTLNQVTDASRRWAAWKPWVVIVTGGAIAAAGGVLHARAAQNFNDYDRRFLGLGCASPSKERLTPGCRGGEINVELRDQLLLARREQSIAVSAYIAGGSLITVGVALLYLNRPRLLEQEASRSTNRQVVVLPKIAADMFGVQVSVAH